MTDTQRTAQELADDLRLIFTDEETDLSDGACRVISRAIGFANRIAALASQAEPAKPMNCLQVPRGNGFCDHCANGNPELCRYTTPTSPAQAEPNQSICLKLDWCAQVLRSIADRGRSALGDSYPDVLQVLDAVKVSREILAAPAQAEQSEDGRDAERLLDEWCEASGARFQPMMSGDSRGYGILRSDLLQLVRAAIAAKERS